MKPNHVIISLLAALGLVLGSCKATSPTPQEGDNGNVSITSFSLKENSKILANLDSVYFAINLMAGEIYNADSLPAGTDVSHLVVKIGTPTVNECLITYRIPGTLRDTTISHIGSPNDSINFTGPVTVKIVSLDKENTRMYRVYVNVHQSHPDSLVWSGNGEQPHPLPTDFATIDGSKTVAMGSKAVCLTAMQGQGCIAVAQDPASNLWEKKPIQLPAGTDVQSFNALGDSLYILAAGQIFSSGDMGASWDPTGARANYLYGSTGRVLAGAVKHDDGTWWHITYPATTNPTPVQADCPIAQTGDLVTFVTQWSTEPVSIFLGGKTASGHLSGDSWGFDGKNWEKLSRAGVNPVAGVSLIPYYTFKVNTVYWNATRESILLALGGIDSEGEPRREVSLSYDCGIHWQKADSLLNLPDFIPAFYGAQAMIFDSLITTSRISKPIDEWTCPYIYLFGGWGIDGKPLAAWWRGVISRLAFRPVY